MAILLKTPVYEFNPLAKKLYYKLKKIGIETVSDLIFYYPFRHDDFSQVVKIKDLQPDLIATVRGRIELIKSQRSWQRRIYYTEAIINDGSGSVRVMWFGQPYLTKVLKPGEEVFIAGKVYHKKDLFFSSPAYEKVTSKKESNGTVHTARLVPVYSLTKGLSSKQLRFIIKIALDEISGLPDYLPLEIKKSLGLVEIWQAVQQIHFPIDKTQLEAAKKRLKFDEVFLIQLRNFLVRQELKKSAAISLEFQEKVIKDFVASLPFKLTAAQKRSAWEILQDLAKSQPMNRMLEGDVGSGKTVVATMAMLDTIKNGYQAVLMAPTEVLAGQHYKNISNLLKKFDVEVGIMTRSRLETSLAGKLSKKEMLEKIRLGRLPLVIGTHALIQDKIKFYNLALAIVDEQHRFGVEQRKTLQEKSLAKNVLPHFLSMTATPIPRTLALTLYGDLDISLINEMPRGRKKVITKVVEHEKRPAAYDFIRKQIKQGRQVFVICPLIDPSDKLGVRSVKEEHQKLDKEIFPELTVGLLHGRLKAEEKEEIMKDFSNGKISVLVSTSVVEVGVDVPNASVMMIEGAERFGLAQLHQFRGRVGRGEHQSYCFLFTDSESQSTLERLLALVASHDGFELAEKDLRFRGPGEMYGTAQSGIPDLRLANLFDFEIIKQAREAASKIVEKDPDLSGYSSLREKLGEVERVHLE